LDTIAYSIGIERTMYIIAVLPKRLSQWLKQDWADRASGSGMESERYSSKTYKWTGISAYSQVSIE
jgi:hypothetical protein